MPYDVEVEDQVCAFAAGQQAEDGRILAQFSQFTSSEDGQEFITKLEAIMNPIMLAVARHTGDQISPNDVSCLLALFDTPSQARVYWNEIPLVINAQIAGPCEKGDPLRKDDIVDILDMDLGDIEIPKTCGLVFYFTLGWRRGLFFDFGPLLSEPQYIRPPNISTQFAAMISHVDYQNRFSMTDKEWDLLFSYKWFPFSGLGNSILNSMINQIRHESPPDILQGAITKRILEKCNSWLTSWKRKGVFAEHSNVLEKAIDHFRNADYLSTSLLLIPRIEGILRSYQKMRSENPKFKPKFLSTTAVEARVSLPKSLLLPKKFRSYLEDVYFAGFDPTQAKNEASRNSVAHGVVSESELDEKAASLAILIVHQLFYLCEESKQQRSAGAPEDVDEDKAT